MKTYLKERKLAIILIILMLSDFLLTFYGVNIVGTIREGNPFLIWLFEIPFSLSLAIRIIYLGFIYVLLEVICKKENKKFKVITIGGILLNLYILGLHINWMLLSV